MKRIVHVGFATLIAGLMPHAALSAPSVNEIMADPASDWDGDGAYSYRDDEWVEVYNAGPGPVNLDEFALSDDTGLWTYSWPTGSVLEVGEAAVVYGSESIAWQQQHGLSSYGFSMSNDGDVVILWHVANGDSIIVDSHTFNTYEAEDDRSTGRDPDGIGAWEIFDARNPYTGQTPPLGNGLSPTPGAPNFGDPPAQTDRTTWGSVKGLFR